MQVTERKTPLVDAYYAPILALKGKHNRHVYTADLDFAKQLEQHAEALAEIAELACEQIACDDPECDRPCCKKIRAALADWQAFQKGVMG